MKTLLRNRLTQRYYREDGRWTRQQRLARDFGDLLTALLFSAEHHLQDLEVVMVLKQPDMEVAVPIEPSNTPA